MGNLEKKQKHLGLEKVMLNLAWMTSLIIPQRKVSNSKRIIMQSHLANVSLETRQSYVTLSNSNSNSNDNWEIRIDNWEIGIIGKFESATQNCVDYSFDEEEAAKGLGQLLRGHPSLIKKSMDAPKDFNTVTGTSYNNWRRDH